MAEKDYIADLREFRLKLIGFLRLPINISEPRLREELRTCSAKVLINYLRRVQRAQHIQSEHHGSRQLPRDRHDQIDQDWTHPLRVGSGR